MAGTYRVHCDIHGWLERDRGTGYLQRAFHSYEDAKTFHNEVCVGPGHDSDNCKIDLERSDDGGTTWTKD